MVARLSPLSLVLFWTACGPPTEAPRTPRQLHGERVVGPSPARFRAVTQDTHEQVFSNGVGARASLRGLQAEALHSRLGLRTVAVGDRPLAAATPSASGNRVRFVHDSIEVRWDAHPFGLAQSWTVSWPRVSTPVLTVDVALSDARVQRIDADGRGATFHADDGGTWRYTGLQAWDARGTDLDARLEPATDGLRVVVDTHGAQWPVEIDPLLSTTWSVETLLTGASGSSIDGQRARHGGDIDGDGYADVLAAEDDSVLVFYGSVSGITADHSDVVECQACEIGGFEWGVDGAGDVNGDGYDDIVASSWADGPDESWRGSAFVYLGSATGVDSDTEHHILASDIADGDNFGLSVAGIGDANGDGYDDIAVGSVLDDYGSVYVYYGSATGIAESSEQKLTALYASSYSLYGWSVDGAGDVNSDGYDDLIVACDSAACSDAFVYYGSATGLRQLDEEVLSVSGIDLKQRAAGAGDLNNDGYDDLVVGAYKDSTTAFEAGSAVVFYGLASGISIGTPLWASDGAASDHFGFEVAGAGDLDGDGYDDLAIGARYDDDLRTNSGAVYIYFGSASGVDTTSELKWTALSSATTSHAMFGQSVDGAGDVDGDGVDDLAVGASGRLYVRSIQAGFSSSSVVGDAGTGVAMAGDADGDGWPELVVGAPDDGDGGSVSVLYGDASGMDPTDAVSIRASDAQASDGFGTGVDTAGDLNGDGYDDLVVGAPGDDGHGSVLVYFGGSSGFSTSSETRLTAADGATGDRFGQSTTMPGDLDGDGYDDLVVGAPGHDGAATDGGALYVFYGASTGVRSTEAAAHTASDLITGSAFGTAVAGAGDLDHDGYDDLIVGAPGDADLGVGAGAAYLFRGSASGLVSATFTKVTASDGSAGAAFGSSVDGAGDVDGDGADDLVVGAAGEASTAADAGALYVYAGTGTGLAWQTETKHLAADGASGDVFGSAVAGVGDVDDDGFDDVLVGAPGDDDQGAGSGSVYVFYGSASGLRFEQKHTAADGGASDAYGTALAGGSDADGDGYLDVVVGAPGAPAAYLLTGSCRDDDDDGYCSDVDCDDGDASVNPGAIEGIGDGIDQDCNGQEDCHLDRDDDGYLDSRTTLRWTSTDLDCDDAFEAYSSAPTGDCDDTDASVNPGAVERVGDGVDQDCDGEESCYVDADTDGYSDGVSVVASADEDCTGVGEASDTTPTGDCDDTNPDVNPGQLEVCDPDATDENCNGLADDDDETLDVSTVGTYHRDDDSDGYGQETDMVAVCSPPGGYVSLSGDCDDTNPGVNPGATEVCSSPPADDDCDGLVDDDDPSLDPTSGQQWHSDSDGDGYGHQWLLVRACVQPEGTVRDDSDCDDDDPAVNPGATEVCDGADTDEDCNGLADDDDPTTDPDTMYTLYVDHDGDGYGDPDTTVSACDPTTAATPDNTDCDDQDADTHPGARERPGDEVDQDCDGEDAPGKRHGQGFFGCSTGGRGTGWWALWGGIGLVARRRSSPRLPAG